MILVDASVWVHALRRDGNPAIQAILRPLILTGNAGITDLGLIELASTLRTSPTADSFPKVLLGIPQLKFESYWWPDALQLAIKARNQGVRLDPLQCLIATAAMNSCTYLMHCDPVYEAIKPITDISTVDLSKEITQ